MGTTYKPGFTIIETMLFLAITGVLVVAILAGTGGSINIQRYRDSVSSLQSILQDQYSEAMNVRNESSNEPLVCDTNATVTSSPDQGRGQSECVILGRYITSEDGTKLSMSSVVGYISPSTKSDTDDLKTLQLYKMNTIPTSLQEYSIEWGSTLVRAASNTPMAFSVLILRSPTSGVVRTFIDPEKFVQSSNIISLVSVSNLNQPLKACVDDGGLLGSRKMAVGIAANATSASGVEAIGDGTSGC